MILALNLNAAANEGCNLCMCVTKWERESLCLALNSICC